MKLNGVFFPIPDIVLSDKQLKDRDKIVLAVIIPLTFEKGYCFATNKYLADKINTSTRTLNVSLANLKEQGWIKYIQVNNRRRIYLSMDKGLITNDDSIAGNYNLTIAESCKYNKKEIKEKKNIKDLNTSNYQDLKHINKITTEWIENPSLCNLKPISDSDKKELDLMIGKYKDERTDVNENDR